MSGAESLPRKRVLLVQSAGDYRAAYHLLKSTGSETYYGHSYILGEIERMQRSFGDVAILCCRSPEHYVDRLDNGVTVMGASAHPRRQARVIKAMMDEWDPTHVIILGPMTSLISWAVGTKRRIFCQFADSFDVPLWKRLWRYGNLPALLRSDRVEWASNHGTNACRSLARFGVPARKILPWDFPHHRTPGDNPPRNLSPSGAPSLLYVGTIQPDKGVGDVILALAQLAQRGIPASLRVIGRGQTERFEKLATSLGVRDQVHFLGTLPNHAVFSEMQNATAVVVPSRPAYPEGLPLTIYEALCARTPLIASDHPMFRGHLVHRQTAMVSPAANAVAMADCVEALVSEPGLYATLSENAPQAWGHMQISSKWGEILCRWLSDTDEDRDWLAAQCLDAPAMATAS